MNRAQDETSDALLAAAHHLLSTVGAEALTVRRIANEAGMSTMNVYSRFGGKDGVIDELYADGYRRLVERLDGSHLVINQSSSPPKPGVVAVIELLPGGLAGQAAVERHEGITGHEGVSPTVGAVT